jgi:toxin ParE1/3/4
MSIRYSTRALADLEDILAFLQRRNPRAAAQAMTAIEDRISLLAMFPSMAPEADEPGIRELSLVRYPYKIYYETRSITRSSGLTCEFSTSGIPADDLATEFVKCRPAGECALPGDKGARNLPRGPVACWPSD